MSSVSQQIYRKINTLFPDLANIEPLTKVELKNKGNPDIELTVLESTPDEITFILSRYKLEHGQLIANPSIEITVSPRDKTANVKTYKDEDYFHSAVPEPDEIGEIALCQANRFLYDWLGNLQTWNRNQSTHNRLHFSR